MMMIKSKATKFDVCLFSPLVQFDVRCADVRCGCHRDKLFFARQSDFIAAASSATLDFPESDNENCLCPCFSRFIDVTGRRQVHSHSILY